MMLDDGNSKEVRNSLHELSASDPAVQANMLRYVAALSLMVGRRSSEKLREGDAEVFATFRMSENEINLQMVTAGRSKIDRVLLALDVDDAVGPPVNLCIVRVEGQSIVPYSNCHLWAPTGVGKSMIVTAASGSAGHFTYREGRTLNLSRDALPGLLELGIKRGWSTLLKLATSDQFAHIESGFMQTVNANGPGSLSAENSHVSGRWREPGGRR